MGRPRSSWEPSRRACLQSPSREENDKPEDAVPRGEDELEVDILAQYSHHWKLDRVGHLAEVVAKGLEHVEDNVGLVVLYMAHIFHTHGGVSWWNLWGD